MERSDEQALANETRFREANEKIGARRRELSAITGATPFLCECEDPRCTQLVSLTLEQYEAVRARELHFLLVRGHPSRGDIVAEHDGYVVVDKG